MGHHYHVGLCSLGRAKIHKGGITARNTPCPDKNQVGSSIPCWAVVAKISFKVTDTASSFPVTPVLMSPDRMANS